MTIETILQAVANSAVLASLYALASVGLVMAYGMMNILNFAHGEIYMLGGFAAYFFSARWGLNFGLTLIVTVLLTGGLGYLIEKLVIRPYRGQVRPTIVTTMGLILLFQSSAVVAFGLEPKSVPSVFPGVVHVVGVVLSLDRLAIVGIATAVFIALFLFFNRTKTGLGMVAAAQDRDAAALQGIDIDRACSLTMLIGGGLAGLAGALGASLFLVHPFVGTPTILMKAMLIVVIGGLGSIPGAVLAALFLGFVDGFGATLWGGPVSTLIAFAVFMVFMFVKPTGLLGQETAPH